MLENTDSLERFAREKYLMHTDKEDVYLVEWITGNFQLRTKNFWVMKWSQILLIVGMVILVAGAVLSILKLQPYSDYVLVAGALVIIFRGAIKAREREDGK